MITIMIPIIAMVTIIKLIIPVLLILKITIMITIIIYTITNFINIIKFPSHMIFIVTLITTKRKVIILPTNRKTITNTIIIKKGISVTSFPRTVWHSYLTRFSLVSNIIDNHNNTQSATLCHPWVRYIYI